MPHKKPGRKSPVETLKHKDKRVNIPTRELEDFVKEEETRPKSMLYPRDPSLDPQLVWKGKDEQDQHPLEIQSSLSTSRRRSTLRRSSRISAKWRWEPKLLRSISTLTSTG